MLNDLIGDSETSNVSVDGTVLDINTSKAIRDHSNGFSWGYLGSGCAQLSLSILLSKTGVKELSVKYYQSFKEEIISNLPVGNDFHLKIDIEKWINKKITFDAERKKDVRKKGS